MPDQNLAEQQLTFFKTFGFLSFPGLLKDRIDEIIREFEEIFKKRGGGHSGKPHEGKQRSCIVPFPDQSAVLSGLLDDPRIHGIASSILGKDFNYMPSDGNYYSGDTSWHSDGWHKETLHIKIAFYLDPLTRDTGCLRVIPGSHHDASLKIWDGTVTAESEANFGVHGRDLPCTPLENEPGDVLIFNHRVLHSSWGGSSERRMFTMNLGRRAKDPKEYDDLISYLSYHIRPHASVPYGKTMLETASPARMVHLTQPQQFWAAGGEHYKLRTAKPSAA